MDVVAGSTGVSAYFYIVQDASGTSPGEPVTGLLFSDIETGGSASYVRQGAARVDLTLVTLASASAAWTSGGFILVDDTNLPGLYRCDFPDAAFASGVDVVHLGIVVASAKNAVAAPITVNLVGALQTGDNYARIGAPVGASISADIAAVKTDSAAILVDTADIQPKIGTPVVSLAADLAVIDDFVDGLETTIGTAGAGLTALGGMSAAMKAEILAEVNAALDTAIAELPQAIPSATPTLRTGMMLLYMALRNQLKVDTTTTDYLMIHNDAGTVIAKKTLTDDTVVYTEAKTISGP